MKLSFCKLQNEICQNMEFKSYFSPDANEESKAKTWKKKILCATVCKCWQQNMNLNPTVSPDANEEDYLENEDSRS